MSLLVSAALVRFGVQGLVLGLLVFAARPLLRRIDASTRFALLLAALMCTPGLVLWNLLDLLGAPAPVGTPMPTPGWSILVFEGWVLGVGLSAARTAWEIRGVQALRAYGLPLRTLHDRLHHLRDRLGVRRAVAIVESPAVVAPIVVGWWRPMILLPMGLATSVPPSWLDAILAHELAHVRRHDLALRMLQRSVEILLFFHPVVWWLARQLDDAREEACDDIVVETLGAPLTYARALTELEAMQQPIASALAAGATEGKLMQRIQHILSHHSKSAPRPSQRWWQALSIAAVLSVSGFAVAGMADDPSPQAEPGSTSLAIAWMPDAVVSHAPQIARAADLHGVDPDLLAIVVLLESRGDTKAVSPRGARGLMQLMPETAQEIADTRGLSKHEAARLDDPSYNLDLGAWYLARHLDRYSELVDTESEAIAWAAAAYNGGPQAAGRAFRGERPLSQETSRYQQLVETLWSERESDTSSVVKPKL